MYKLLKILTPLVLLFIFALLQFFQVLTPADNLIHDTIMVSGRPVADNIIIVGIDERSINEIGAWPWTRDWIAEAITQLTEMNAAVIGVNVLYDVPGAAPEFDEMLVAAAQAADGRLVLGGMGVIGIHDGELLEMEYYVLPFPALYAAANVGFLNMTPDGDGVMRRALTDLRFGDIRVHSFPYEIYRTYAAAMGREPRIPGVDFPLDIYGQFPINYAAGPRTFTALSLWGVINEYYPAAMFNNAIVLIGPYAMGIGDGNFPTPANRAVATFGVEIIANIVQNLIDGEFKQDAPMWVNLAILVALGLLVIIFFRAMKTLHSLVLTAVCVVLLLGGAWLAYGQFSVILQVSTAVLFLVLAFVVNLLLTIMATQNEKQHIQGLFGRFVSPEVVKQIINSGGKLELGGAVKEISVVFVDIRGFTAFSEANPPEKVVEMVNRYLGLTSRSIQENGGTIDKYIGDATMAIFNAPNDLKDHALCACKAAWAMKQGSVALREEILEQFGVDLQFGVGVNTGPAVIGNMGSDFRMDYTAIGDTVNTAARLESNSQKGQIIISDATYQMIKDHVQVTDLGLLNVKNKAVGIQIYNLEGIN